MPGLGIFSWFSYSLPIGERLRLIREAGFDATALWWGDDQEQAKDRQPDLARGLSLDIDYVHAPGSDPNDLWRDCLGGEAYFNALCACVKDCRRHGIPTVVAHITRLSSSPPVSAIGLERVKRLVALAETMQVNIALENMNGVRHLDYLFANIPSDRLGFCYDSGHEHYAHPDANCLSRYGDRLLAVHIDDNFGDDDTHLLPFDGTIDWDEVVRGLSACRSLRNMTLEADFNRNNTKSAIYQRLSAAEFLATAFARLQKLHPRERKGLG